MIYFSAEATARYEALGLPARAGYFPSRSAAMGTASAEIVIATFYNFNPALIRTVLPGAWEVTTPSAVLQARLGGADATLREILGQAVLDSPDLARAAALARRAAESVADDLTGRPLYAAHTTLPWPEQPHLVLWHAQTLLREYRGDGHVAALLTAGLSGVEALITHSATGAISAEALRATRGWSAEDWETGVAGLQDRGWLTADGTLTPLGQEGRQQVEDTTDRLAALPYTRLGADDCAELRTLAGPLTTPLIDTLMPWAKKAT
jgi:helix-turn-helix protein